MRIREYFQYERESLHRWACNLLINLPPDWWIINRFLRPAVARLCAVKCGSGIILQKGIFYGNTRNIRIGNKSAICRGVFLDGYDKITIGDNVAIAFQVTLITSNHEMGTAQRRVGKVSGNPIVIGNGVWIAARAIIGPGVEVGAGSMISPGAALMQSVPPNSLVSGVPGKVIMRLASGVSSEPAPKLAPAPVSVPAQLPKKPVPAPGPAEPAQQPAPAPEPALVAVSPPKDGTLTKGEFYADLESLLEMDRGSIQGTESLHDLHHWDSMAVLAFIALADSKLQEVVAPSALANCRTVPDLVNLFPGKII